MYTVKPITCVTTTLNMTEIFNTIVRKEVLDWHHWWSPRTYLEHDCKEGGTGLASLMKS